MKFLPKNLNFYNFSFTSQAESVIQEALEQAINIKILELDFINASRKINLNHLEHLVDLTVTSGVSISDIIEMLKPCQKLKSLSLTYTQAIQEKSSYYSLISVIGTMPQLTVLDLELYDTLPSDSFEGLNNLLNLKQLQIYGKQVNIDSMFKYLKKLRSLVRVLVSSEYSESNSKQNFKTLREGEFQLQELILDLRFNDIDAHSLEDDLGRLQNLRELEISFPNQLDGYSRNYYSNNSDSVKGQLDLGKLTKLRTLTIHGDGNNVKASQDLFLTSLQFCTQLRYLSLSLVQEADILEKIAQLLNLKSLNLEFHESSAEITLTQFSSFFAGLKNMNKIENITIISQKTSCLDDSLVNALAQSLEGKNNLKRFDLNLKDATEVTDKSFMKLINVLFTTNSNLEYFGFVCETLKGISGQSVELLFDSLKQCKKMQEFYFDVCGNNNIADSTIDAILPMIKEILAQQIIHIQIKFENMARVQQSKLEELRPYTYDKLEIELKEKLQKFKFLGKNFMSKFERILQRREERKLLKDKKGLKKGKKRTKKMKKF